MPGFLGGLVILDKDYLTAPADEIRFIRPVMTVVGGRVVYEAKPWHAPSCCPGVAGAGT